MGRLEVLLQQWLELEVEQLEILLELAFLQVIQALLGNTSLTGLLLLSLAVLLLSQHLLFMVAQHAMINILVASLLGSLLVLLFARCSVVSVVLVS